MVDAANVYGGLARPGRLASIGVFVVFLLGLAFFSSYLSWLGINPLYAFIIGLLILSYPMYKLYQRDKQVQERYIESSMGHQVKREKMLASFAKSQGKCQSCYKPLDEGNDFCANCGHKVDLS